jgi:hypothetical protein
VGLTESLGLLEIALCNVMHFGKYQADRFYAQARELSRKLSLHLYQRNQSPRRRLYRPRRRLSPLPRKSQMRRRCAAAVIIFFGMLIVFNIVSSFFRSRYFSAP